MEINELKKIDFASLDRKFSAFLLRENDEELTAAATLLEKNGLTIWVGSSSAELYAHIGNVKPGYVFVDARIGKEKLNQIIGFLNRRMKVPVVLFHPEEFNFIESGIKAPIETETASHFQCSQAIGIISSFEKKYESRIREIHNIPETESQNVFFDKIKTIIKNPESDFSQPNEQLLSVLKLPDPQSNGFFIFAFPVTKGAPSPIEAIENLENQIRQAHPESAQLEPIDHMLKYNFFQTLIENSDKVIRGFIGEQEMIISYFSTSPEVIPESVVEYVEDRIMVGIEDWWTEIPLNFNAYLWLEKNERKFIYVKKGDRLRQEAFKKLKDKGYQKMALKPDEMAAYKKLRDLFHASRKKSA